MATKKKVSKVASRLKDAPKGESPVRQTAKTSKASDVLVEEDEDEGLELACPGRLEHGTPNALGTCPYCDAQLDTEEEEEDEPNATSDINSLSVGDFIWIQKSQARFKVTCVDRNVGADGPLVELKRPDSPKTLYTLMRHAKKPATFVLSTSRSSRDIDGWRKVEGR